MKNFDSFRCVISLLCVGLVSGCAFNPPQPWEKEILSMPSMSLNGANDRIDMHIYTSKENSSGNGIVGLGGCGCN